jgi:poly [ADP-ribose] polymerase
MGRVAKLIMTSAANNNKYYDMVEAGGTIQVKYGRVGSTECSASYPVSQWDKLRNSKIKKGYKDVTHLRIETESIDFSDIADDRINQIVTRLQMFANKSVSTNYTVSSSSVTVAQVAEAQRLLDELLILTNKKKLETPKFDSLLLDLYQVIPRRMSDVKSYLVANGRDPLRAIADEQSMLDVMKGQVKVAAAKQKNTLEDKKTILEAMGLSIVPATKDDEAIIQSQLGDVQKHYKQAWVVKNNCTEDRFVGWLEKAANKKKSLFWHGSRNENWWSILDSGLVLRPTNAIITGRMYGTGTYFADKARKSFNYTSYSGSYWARGTEGTAFMCMYDVHLGNQLCAKRHEQWMTQLTEKKLKEKGDYDSFFAEGGVDLINNEYIVYNEAQCTVRYLVEFK